MPLVLRMSMRGGNRLSSGETSVRSGATYVWYVDVFRLS